jgi:hypothetical protein
LPGDHIVWPLILPATREYPPFGAAEARCSMIVNAAQNGQTGAAAADW